MSTAHVDAQEMYCPYGEHLNAEGQKSVNCQGRFCPKWVEERDSKGHLLCIACMDGEGSYFDMPEGRKKCRESHGVSNCMYCEEVIGHCAG